MDNSNQNTSDILEVEGINAKGYGIIPKLLMINNNIPLSAKTIYAYFCSFAGAGITAFPSRSKILSDLSINKETYYRLLNLLKENDYIRTKQEFVQGSKFGRNIFTLVAKPAIENEDTQLGKFEVIIKNEGVRAQGYGTVPKVVMTDKRLHIKSKGIYAYFCSFSGAGVTAFPKIDNLTFALSINKDTFYKYLKPLKDYGYISAEQSRECGQFKATIYTLNEFPFITTEKPCTDSSDTVIPDTIKPCTDSSDTVFSDTEKPDTEFPDTTKPDTNSNKRSLKNNNSYNYQSINQQPPADNTDGTNEGTEEKLIELYECIGVDHICHKENIDEIKGIIMNLWITRRVNKTVLKQSTIESILSKLSPEHIDATIDNVNESSKKKPIGDITEYYKTALVNSTYSLTLQSNARYNYDENHTDKKPSFDIDDYVRLSMERLQSESH